MKQSEMIAVHHLTELSSCSLGSRVLFATDEWFAPANNLLKVEEPIFIHDKFTSYGKWMDGWESRRKRIVGHDWCLIELGVPGILSSVDINTAFFTGNFAPKVSIQAICIDQYTSKKYMKTLDQLRQKAPNAIEERTMGVCASSEDVLLAESLRSHEWTEILPITKLEAGYPSSQHNLRSLISTGQPYTHIRLNMYPDGGIARLRIYGHVCVNWNTIPSTKLIDLGSILYGGQVLAYNDAHYGHPKNLLKPSRSLSMADGWETLRKLTRPEILEADPHTGLLHVPGKDWAMIKLGHSGQIHEIEIDTNHFKGNFPESAMIWALDPKIKWTQELEKRLLEQHEQANQIQESLPWVPILPRIKLSPHAIHRFSRDNKDICMVSPKDLPISIIKLEMFPDGGISRLRLFGYKATLEQPQYVMKMSHL